MTRLSEEKMYLRVKTVRIMNIVNWYDSQMSKIVPKETFNLESWRNWFAKVIIIVAALGFPLAMIATLPVYIREQNYLMIALDLVLWLFLIGRALVKGQSYLTNKFLFLAVIYTMTIAVFISQGPVHARPVWIVLCTIMACLLFGLRAAIFSILLNAAILMLLYGLIGPENPAWAAEYAAPMSRWIMFVVNVSIITLVSCIPIGLLLQRLDSSLEFERKNHERQNIEKEKLLIAFRKLQGEIIGRKKIEEALRESEDKFRLISEQSLMGIMISQDRRVKYANEALSKLSGYTTEEILSWEPNESLKLIHPDYRELALEQGVKKKSNDQEGVVPSYEVKGIRKSGEERWIDVYSRTITYQGRSANLTTLIDVTGRRKDQEALRKSEKKYRDLIENIDEAIFTLDQAGRITYVSQACESIIGYKPEQLIGHSALDFIHEEDRPQMQLDFQKSIDGKAEKSEYRIVHKSGEIRWAQSLSNVIYDGSQVVGLRGVLSDITEQKIAQAEKRNSKSNLYRLKKWRLLVH